MPNVFERLRNNLAASTAASQKEMPVVQSGQDEGVVANVTLRTPRGLAETGRDKAEYMNAVLKAGQDQDVAFPSDLADAIAEELTIPPEWLDFVKKVEARAGVISPTAAAHPRVQSAIKIAKQLKAQEAKDVKEAQRKKERSFIGRLGRLGKSLLNFTPQGWGKLPDGFNWR